MKKRSKVIKQRYMELAKALLKNPGVMQPMNKKGFGSSALYTGDKIFTFLSHKNRLILKLPRERVNELVARRDATRWNPRGEGGGLREWAVLRLSSKVKWLPLAREALKFVASQSQEH